MEISISKTDMVSISRNGYTIQASGKQAELIAGTAVTMIILVGLATVIKMLS